MKILQSEKEKEDFAKKVEGNFDEKDHPRDSDGKFTQKGGGSSGGKAKSDLERAKELSNEIMEKKKQARQDGSNKVTYEVFGKERTEYYHSGRWNDRPSTVGEYKGIPDRSRVALHIEKKSPVSEHPQLDKTLIQRANDSSNAFDFGDSITKKYEKDIEEIKSMDSVKDKEVAIKKIHELRTAELETRGHAIGPYTYGPARLNTSDSKNFDKATKAAVAAGEYMESLRKEESKGKVQSRKDNLVSQIKEAESKGVKEISVNGKTYYKSGKSWTTKKPA